VSESSTVSIPDSPYKGLAAFADSAGDAAFFFGREGERETIVANLLADRVTVLYGPSGVGKSSLLRAGVAQQMRHLGDAVVVVHDSWTDDPVAGLVAAIAEAVPGLGPTAGLADAVAAAAANGGELFLLLDQFEEYFLYHGTDGPLSVELPELLRRRGLRVSVLIALRDDALSELDAFTDRLPALFANLLRLDRLDRNAAREAIVSPLARYSELAGAEYRAEPELVDAILDEVAAGRVDFTGASETGHSDTDIEAPFLQLVLERLWAEEQAMQSTSLRLETFRRLGGAEPIVREHVQGALERLPAEQQDEAARVVRQLVTSSGTKVAHTAADLAEYADVAPMELQPLLDTLARERIVCGVDASPGRPTRYEIFHDILAAPVLAWRVGYEVEREKLASARQRKRLRAIVAAAVVALIVVGSIAVYAFVQRSDARTEARQAHGRELAADALAGIPTDPASSTALALRAATLAPGPQSENVLRSSLLALRETRAISVGGAVVGASFAPKGGRLLVAGSNGRAALYSADGRLFALLPREGSPTRIAWSADGKLFALGYTNGTVTLWDVGGGQGGHPPLRTIRTSAPVTALAFAGQSLLVAGGGHLRLLPSPSARVRAIRVSGGITAAGISPNGRLIAFAAQRKGEVNTRVFDLRTHHLRYALEERGIDSLVFSANSRLLVTGSSDKTARIRNAANGHVLHILTMRGHVLSERFSSDGQWLVTASTDGTAAIWNVRSGQRNLLLTGANGGANDAAFSPDGKEVAVAFADRIARIYSTQDGRLLAPLAGHGDTVTSVGYDPSGTRIVTGSADGTARLWQANPTGQLTTIDKRTSAVTALFASDDVVSVSGNEARVLAPTGQPVARLRLPARITTEAADGNELALADSQGDLLVGPPGSGHRLLKDTRIDALAFAPNGALLAGSTDGTVRIWKSIAGMPISVHLAQPVIEVAAGADRFAVRTAQGEARVYSLSGALIASIGEKAQRIALSPDGRTLATTHAREADLWDASSGRLLRRLTGHRSLVTDAEFSPDSRLVVTASDDHDGRLWDVATGQLLHVLRGHFFPVRSATFSPSGRWIVTASQFTGGLWDATTGQLVLYLQGHTAPLTSATFGSDGSWIVTGSDDNTASVFRCDVCRDLAGLEAVARQRLAPLQG
jgi:WD40 repeat protein